MFDVTIITPPNTLPVTLTEVKEHLHITDTDNDTKLNDLREQVTRDVEKKCGISIGSQVRQLIADMEGYHEYAIPYGPVTDVVEVSKKTDYQTYTVLTVSDDYDVDGSSTLTVTPFETGRFKIRYECGNDTFDDSLKMGILCEIAHRYENRGDQKTDGFSVDAWEILRRFKDYSWE